MGLSSPELVTYSILYAVIPSSAMDMTVHGTFEILFFVKMLFMAAKILSTLRLIYMLAQWQWYSYYLGYYVDLGQQLI